MENIEKKFFKLNENKEGVRIVIVFLIAIFLQIPLFFINSIISDRQNSYNQASRSIGNDWGKAQELAGPYLVAIEDIVDNNGKTYNKTTIILPDNLNADINLESEKRSRGIYETTVYLAKTKINGIFDTEKIPKEANSVYLAFGMTDTKALVNIDSLNFAGSKEIKIESGTKSREFLENGFSTENIKHLIKDEKVAFNLDLSFRGSDNISVLPFGEKNDIAIASNWSSPSYRGILPLQKEDIEKGFKANWKISNLVRNYPQVIVVDENTREILNNYPDKYMYENDYYSDTAVSVKLIDSVNHYTQISRATNYGMLFIMLSLILVFIFDIINKEKTRWLQYGVIGFSLVCFYLLLLSLSEHLGFNVAYIISSLAIVIPNGLYMWSISSNKKFGIYLAVFLSSIYTILFSILKMEKYALLSGTLLIMFILYLVMYITRNNKFLKD